MTTETTKIPNELLVRWTDTGVLSGAHVRYLEILKVEGEVVMAKMGDAIPISVAGDFPFQKFLPDIQAGAIASAERAWAEVAATKESERIQVAEAFEQVAAAQAQASELQSKLVQALTANAELQGRLDKLTGAKAG